MENLDVYVNLARNMIKQDIVIAPWLTWGDGRNRIPSNLQRDIEWTANRLANQYWNPNWRFNLVGSFPITKDRAREALYETVSGTAVYLSHLELGQMGITEEMVRVAERLTENFLTQVGPQQFVTFYLLTVIYEDLQALEYYGSMHAKDFVHGNLHRPWGTETLRAELDAAISTEVVEVDTVTGLVRLTTLGQEVLRDIEWILRESGFLKSRSRLIRLHNFNNFDDMDSITEKLGPNVPQLRRTVIELSLIQPGMTVLELGCGTGGLTFDAGLFQVVGPNGRLVATDPSMSMLAAVRRKRDIHDAHWVEVVHAKAERLPFPANSFDSVIGYAFLQFTNLDEACREIQRVLKPGGTFTTLHPLHFPARSDFFVEWFEPLLKASPPSGNHDTLPGPDTVPSAMEPYFEIVDIQYFDTELHYTSPSIVVEAFVEIANVFEEPMARLPWRARQDMVKQLIQRGEEICRRYPQEMLVERHPCQFIRAIVPKQQ